MSAEKREHDLYSVWLTTHYVTQSRTGLYFPTYTNAFGIPTYYYVNEKDSTMPEWYRLPVEAKAALLLHFGEYERGLRRPREVAIALEKHEERGKEQT